MMSPDRDELAPSVGRHGEQPGGVGLAFGHFGQLADEGEGQGLKCGFAAFGPLSVEDESAAFGVEVADTEGAEFVSPQAAAQGGFIDETAFRARGRGSDRRPRSSLVRRACFRGTG